MNAATTISMLLGMLTLTACRQVDQGTPGTGGYQSGTAHAEGSTPYAAGRTSPFQRAGLADANIAISRAEAAMDVSGSGTAELSRRSAAATVRSNAALDEDEPEPAIMSADEILLNRINLALSSPENRISPESETLSIQTLTNLRLDVRDGVAILRGRVQTADEANTIEQRVRSVEGVTDVINELDVASPPGNAATAPAP